MHDTSAPIRPFPSPTSAQPDVFGDTTEPARFLRERPVHELIRRQAHRKPTAVAVRCAGRTTTFSELNGIADQFRRRLRDCGVGRGAAVALRCRRTADAPAAMYAALSAGVAYVPIDPDSPVERSDGVIRNSGAVALDVDPDSAGGRRPESPTPFAAVTFEDAAYIMYTSGSTGAPKGVVVDHGNLAFSTRARFEHYGESPERFLLLSPFAFDSSVAGIYWTLCGGGELIIPDEDVRRDPAQTAALVADARVTHLLCLPSFYEMLLHHAEASAWANLRTAIVAGETCPPRLVERHVGLLPRTRLFNEYGPTECTVWSTVFDCRSRPVPSTVPIGSEIPGARVYILDDRGRSPDGAVGEICVAGPGVARGYRNAAEPSAARFCVDPFSETAGGRMYRTGDYGRRRPDGMIEFLGRRDEQVKLRGHRVELAEVDAALLRLPGVRAGAAVVGRNPAGAQTLTAFLVGPTLRPSDRAAFRRGLAGVLPEFMIPSAFTVLDVLPTNPNGKVDRAALAALPDVSPALAPDPSPAADGLGRLVARLWREQLGTEPGRSEDSFFESGGNSIQAALFVHRLQQELGVRMHVALLFRVPRFGDLTAHLAREYPDAVAKIDGSPTASASADAPTSESIDEAVVSRFRSLIPPPRRTEPAPHGKNPSAVFIVCPPRSGSTLLRVMLAGHPRLFAPPELELLNFATMDERRIALAGPQRFLGEGLLRALTQADGSTVDEAERFVESCARRGLTVKEFYRRLQDRLAGRLLVDKTAAYCLDPNVLRRAENDFCRPKYVHLVRHPAAVVRSFEEIRLEQVFFRHPHPFSGRMLAELTWLVGHRNILELKAEVPASRWHCLKFEELVAGPDRAAAALCAFLSVEFDANLLNPYDGRRVRMTDPATPHSQMQGDPKFGGFRAIDPAIADAWRRRGPAPTLSAPTRRLALELGYTEDFGDGET